MRNNYNSAVAKLQKLRRGQVLTQSQLHEIFGDFDGLGSSCAEERDAFSAVVRDGWLIEESPGQWRVASRSRQESAKSAAPEMDKVDKIIGDAVEAIKAVVVSQIRVSLDKFPLITVMTSAREGDYLYSAETKQVRALILEEEDRGFRNCHMVIVTDEGIFDYRCGRDSKTMNHCPDWTSESDSGPLIWIKYAQLALREMKRM